MKRKAVHHHKAVHHLHHHKATASKNSQDYLVILRGWMFIVMFAVMLGIGAIVGNFINQQVNQATPVVAGAHTSR